MTIVGSSYLSEDEYDEHESSSLQPYIAARFLPRAIPRIFQLGDGDSYNGYQNRRLDENMQYRVFLRAIVDTPQKVGFDISTKIVS